MTALPLLFLAILLLCRGVTAQAARYTLLDRMCPYPTGTVPKSPPRFDGWKEGAQFAAKAPKYQPGKDLALHNSGAHNPSGLHFDQWPGWYVVDAGLPAALVGFSYQCTSKPCPGFLIQYTDSANTHWSLKTAQHGKSYSDPRQWTTVARQRAGSKAVDKKSAGGYVTWRAAGCHRFWRFVVDPKSWRGGPWYYNFQWFGVAQQPLQTWHGAQKACLEQGQTLATAHSSYDYLEIAQAARPAAAVWIGANDLDTEGNWTWADGSPFDATNWAPHEPNGRHGENCGQMYVSNAKINDCGCDNRKLQAVCEAQSIPVRVDSTFPAFSVAAAAAQPIKNQAGHWVTLKKWTANHYKGLVTGFEMDMAAGRFTVHYPAVYAAAAMVRLDYADTGWFAFGVFANGEHSWSNGCNVLSGHNPSPKQKAKFAGDPMGFANNHFTVACLMHLDVGDFTQAEVKANSDRDYQVATESSGFSMSMLKTRLAFASTHSRAMTLSKQHGHIKEIQYYSTSAVPTLLAHRAFDHRAGRFRPRSAGVYLATATFRLDRADKGYFDGMILTNAIASNWNHNGINVIMGDPANNYEDVAITGVRHLDKDDFLSVWVFASADDDYQVNSINGGFSCAKLDTSVALSVASNCGKGKRVIRTKGWVELGKCDDHTNGWTANGYKSLFTHKSFDAASGRFTASAAGMYFASGMARFDSASTGIITLAILTNGQKSESGGMSVSDSGLASSYDSLVVTGIRALMKGDFLSMWAFADSDTYYTVANGDRSGFHIAQLSTELPSLTGSDIDVQADGLVWQEVWGHPVNHTEDDAGWEHVGKAGTWGTCKPTREARIQCCADECVRLGPRICVAFAIHAPARDQPPTVCHYISPQDMSGTCMHDHSCITQRENFGRGWGTWIPDLPHGLDAVHSLLNHKTCNFDNFFSRSDKVNRVCCATDSMCNKGMPKKCDLKCAQAFIPFFDECKHVLKELLNDDITSMQKLDADCSTNSAEQVWKELAGLQRDGCTFGNTASVAALGSDQRRINGHLKEPVGRVNVPGHTHGGGHRRRNQGLNFHRRFESKSCPHATFRARVAAVDKVCCMQRGVNVCPPGGVPAQCSIECGLIYRSFFKECNSWIKLVMDDEYKAFAALAAQCNAHSTHELLGAMLTAVCQVPAASCAEYSALAPMNGSGVVSLRSAAGVAFDTHCAVASDLGTTGHPFTRFWHYTGGPGAVFPPGVTDVLADQYGMCADKNACFGRLPPWLTEKGSELVVTDGSTTISFTFDPNHNVAHTAWQAFHDHATGRKVGGKNWTPTLLQGKYNTIQPKNTDSFVYEKSWGIKSLLLDDDGCYCNSVLEAGKIMCGTTNTWQASKQGATLPAGIDFVAPTKGCEFVSPTKGPLSLYYREPEQPLHATCATIKSKHPRAKSGVYTIGLGNDKCSASNCDACASATACLATASKFGTCVWNKDLNECGRELTFRTPGSFTFVVPRNVNTVRVQIWGGGGGGGAGNGHYATGGGGGGFAMADVSVVPGQQIPIVVGAGGKGAIKNGKPCGQNSGLGERGGDSKFGTAVMAQGGAAGHSTITGNKGGAGGRASSQSRTGVKVQQPGATGGHGGENTAHGGNAGGTSYHGGRGGAGQSNFKEGKSGAAPGGGGSGGASCQNGHHGGGNGASGAVYLFTSFVGTAGKGQVRAYCDMETLGGGWTLVMHQRPNTCLSAATNQIGALDGDISKNFRFSSEQLSRVGPTTAWMLRDAKNEVFFRPGCVVDFAHGHLRHKNDKECEQGFTTPSFQKPTSAASLQDNGNGSDGIGMNNGGRFCSIRAFLDKQSRPGSSLTRGCATPCDPASTGNWRHPPSELVQLWFK